MFSCPWLWAERTIMSESKVRYFAFILYPDSLPEDWLVKLETLGVPMAVSPLHDKDRMAKKSDEAMRKEAERRASAQCKDIQDETAKAAKYAEARQYWLGVVRAEQQNLPDFKKPHYHVEYINPNPVTAESVLKKIRRKLGNNAVSHVELVDNVENYYLYLTHESADAKAKNKHVYDSKDIKCLSGFDISRYVTMDREQKKDAFVRLVELIDRENIMNMRQLIAYIRKHGKDIGIESIGELITITDSNAWFLKMVFDGNYQEDRLRRLRMDDVEA